MLLRRRRTEPTVKDDKTTEVRTPRVPVVEAGSKVDNEKDNKVDSEKDSKADSQVDGDGDEVGREEGEVVKLEARHAVLHQHPHKAGRAPRRRSRSWVMRRKIARKEEIGSGIGDAAELAAGD